MAYNVGNISVRRCVREVEPTLPRMDVVPPAEAHVAYGAERAFGDGIHRPSCLIIQPYCRQEYEANG
jgi:hypothetical protein